MKHARTPKTAWHCTCFIAKLLKMVGNGVFHKKISLLFVICLFRLHFSLFL